MPAFRNCLTCTISRSVLIFFLITLLQIPIASFASSPSFVRQEIRDDVTDWKYFNDSSLEAQNKTAMPNLEAVSYSSDGKFLNATLWVHPSFNQKPSDAGQHYLIYIDVDANNRTGFTGADYAVGIRWENDTWWDEFMEWSSHGKVRAIREEGNHTGFWDIEGNSIQIAVDLEAINFPNQYNVAFSAEDFSNFVFDTTTWVPIPPTEITISTQPSSLVLRQGEEKTLELHINSTTNLQPEIQFRGQQKQDFSDIILSIEPNRTVIPSYDSSLELRVKVSENAQSRLYKLPIVANITFPLERLDAESLSFKKTTYLSLSVLPALTIPEHINGVLNTYGSPVKESIALISAIGGIGGLSTWFVNKQRKKRKDNLRETNAE